MIGNRAVDVDEIDVRIGQDGAEIGISPGDAEPFAHLIQPALRPLAYGGNFRFRMRLIDRNELRTESEANEADSRSFHGVSPFDYGQNIGPPGKNDHEQIRENM